MIFEFKDATAVKGGETLFSDVSFVAQPGDAVAVTGNAESRKALLLAMLGMRPLKSGWVSIDGEPVTATTGTYFRQFIAYQPDSLDFEGLTVQEVAKSQFALKVNADYAYSAKSVVAELMRLGVADDCMQKGFDNGGDGGSASVAYACWYVRTSTVVARQPYIATGRSRMPTCG